MSHPARIVPLILVLIACASAPGDGPGRDADLNAAKRRAAVQLEAAEFGAAVQTLEALAARRPRDDQVFTMLGDAHRGLGEFDPAVRAYEQAIRIAYGNHIPHLKLGTWLMEHGKTGRALTEFEVAVRFGNHDPLAHFNYGLALRELGRPDEALAQWRIARDLDPGNARIHEAVGIGLSGVDDRAAVESFERAEALGRTGGSFLNNFALALERTGRHDEAERKFAAAVDAPDAREEYGWNLALHYMRAGRYVEAAQRLEALTATYGVRWSHAVYRARAYVEMGRYDDALAVFGPFDAEIEADRLDRKSGRVDRVPPTLAEALSQIGMAWRGKKDLARARANLERAVALDPRETSYLNNYGVVLAESGMLAEARVQWRRVLEIDPGNARARDNLSAYDR